MSIANTQKAYDKWSEQYDTNVNKTRDLEATPTTYQILQMPH